MLNPPIEQGTQAPLNRKYTAIRAVVTRADGTVEDRGIVSFTHRNPVINFFLSPLARLNGWAQEKRFAYRQRRKSR